MSSAERARGEGAFLNTCAAECDTSPQPRNFAKILDTPLRRTVKSGSCRHCRAAKWSGEQIGGLFFERVEVMNRRLLVCLASSVMGMLAVAALVASNASVARAANGKKIEVLDQLRKRTRFSPRLITTMMAGA